MIKYCTSVLNKSMYYIKCNLLTVTITNNINTTYNTTYSTTYNTTYSTVIIRLLKKHYIWKVIR